MSTPTHFESRNPLASERGLLVADVVRRLHEEGYAPGTVRKRRGSIARFLEWLEQHGIQRAEASESHVVAFLGCAAGASRHRIHDEAAGARWVVRYLFREMVPRPPANRSPIQALLDRYVTHLRGDRGLTPRTIQIYIPLVQAFLEAWAGAEPTASPAELDPLMVRTLALAQIRGRGHESARLRTVAIRSFLRYLLLSGETAKDLSQAVPAPRHQRAARLQANLSAGDVEKILATPDPSTPGGRRDRAILLLLARLGLRAGEVASLELEDLRWRSAEIAVRGKGRSINLMPLPGEVGEALASYLQHDRGPSASRRIFLRKMAPHVPLSGPAAIGHVVRAALARAGLRAPRRGAAHLLRHSLATEMIRHGASLPEIGQILRHRSSASTQIYAQVDFPTLRGVARPWPGNGGEA